MLVGIRIIVGKKIIFKGIEHVVMVCENLKKTLDEAVVEYS